MEIRGRGADLRGHAARGSAVQPAARRLCAARAAELFLSRRCGPDPSQTSDRGSRRCAGEGRYASRSERSKSNLRSDAIVQPNRSGGWLDAPAAARAERYMASNDPDFETGVADIIGLYLNPPAQAALFCEEEKTAIRASDRSIRSCPSRCGMVSGTDLSTARTARRRCTPHSTRKWRSQWQDCGSTSLGGIRCFLRTTWSSSCVAKEIDAIADKFVCAQTTWPKSFRQSASPSLHSMTRSNNRNILDSRSRGGPW